MLTEAHEQIIYRLIQQKLQMAGCPKHVEADDLFQAAYMAVFSNPSVILNTPENGEYFTIEGVRLISQAAQKEIYHCNNTGMSIKKRGMAMEYNEDMHTSLEEDEEEYIEPSKVFAKLTMVERDVLGGQLQRYNRNIIAKVAKISVEEVEEITNYLLDDPKVQKAFLIQAKRIREDIPKFKTKVRVDRLTPAQRRGNMMKWRRRRLGLCPCCGGDPAKGRAMCRSCMDKGKKWNRVVDPEKQREKDRIRGQKKRDKLRAARMCMRCGKNPPEKNTVQCEVCNRKKRKENNARYHERAKKGLCVGCGIDFKPNGTKRCPKCNDVQVRAHEKHKEKGDKYQRRLAKGLCGRCGQRPPKKDGKHCELCLMKARKKYKKKAQSENCVNCGKPRDDLRMKFCLKCRTSQKNKYDNGRGKKIAARRKLFKESGFCGRCGKNPPDGDSNECKACKKIRARTRKSKATVR